MKHPIVKSIIFYALYPLIYLFAYTPTPILYLFSNGLFYIVYHAFGYRKKVVFQNLKNSFPEKSAPEINAIAIKYYHFLCDFLVETAKYMTISKKELLKRVSIENEDVLDKIFDSNRSMIVLLGHYGNWEWAAPSCSILTKFQLFVIYKRLSNKHFEKLMRNTRSRFGTKLIEMNDVGREMFKNRNIIGATIFVGDQTPFPEQAYWTTFLNQDTPIFRGAEVLAKKFDQPVIYVTIDRPQRGKYTIKVQLITDDPKNTPEGWICEQYSRLLEKDIIHKPEIWLWSHRRWKHRKPSNI
ncbi:MAG: lysophospholipid acyltransferase family protein [Bacteroidota bacterium]|nr:lysophospholipid acyltransferase family protein [Bacteroidota bacterium]